MYENAVDYAYTLSEGQVDALVKHHKNLFLIALQLLDEEFKFAPTPTANWTMLGQHLLELLQLGDATAFSDIINLMIEQMVPWVGRDPFVAAALAETGNTDRPEFQQMLEQMISAVSKNGLIHFHAGFIGLGDHFSTLWALRLIALAGKTTEYENLVINALDALEADLDYVLSRSPDFVGFLLYVTLMFPDLSKAELIARCIQTLKASQSSDGWWYANLNQPVQDLRSCGFVAYDLMHALEQDPSALQNVEVWLASAFALASAEPSELPEPFTWARSNLHPDVWLQGWLRALVAATVYLRIRRPDYSVVPTVASQYVNAVNRNRHAANLLQLLRPYLLPEDRINRYRSYLAKFHEEAPFETSVFVMRRMADDSTMQSVLDAILVELEKQGLKGRYVGDHPSNYDSDVWENNVVYMQGCKYGIAIFERRQVAGVVPFGPNHNVLVELGFMRGKGSEVLILYDESSMNAPVVGATEPPEGIGLPTVIDGTIRKSFASDDGQLTALRQVVRDWTKGIAKVEGTTQTA